MQAEIMDLRADSTPRGEAVVLDARMRKSVGVELNTIVRWGTLRVGDYIVGGTAYGRTRMLVDQTGARSR